MPVHPRRIQELLDKHSFKEVHRILNILQDHVTDSLYSREMTEVEGNNKEIRQRSLQRLLYPFPVTNSTINTVVGSLHSVYLTAAKEFLIGNPESVESSPTEPDIEIQNSDPLWIDTHKNYLP